ncbi:cobalt ECF transporter T component CbiQ [Herbidospora mongoliensis]|uniref:cobalt ECF transporter T component CbiQ n=1 Tax=Herbidospora mongoliensis TaxID=688067 RepID=UPI000829D6AC|nr:cobalt ECF transporter T component CbiQ [Herbidospora mongoliensis]
MKGLYRPGDSPIHRLAPQCKLVAVVLFAVVVVATPRERFWAFFLYALTLAAVTLLARVPVGYVLKRLAVELPFVVFALAIPFIGVGERIDVMGVSLSVAGLWAAWNILAKATLGVAASILLAATTEPRALLLGAQRLRVPQLLIQIATFMLRYLEVILDEMRRMKVARESRGFTPRDLRQAPVLAKSAGALFIRSYERGERVHLAMLSRGYTGTMPTLRDDRAPKAQWAMAAVLPVVASAVLFVS